MRSLQARTDAPDTTPAWLAGWALMSTSHHHVYRSLDSRWWAKVFTDHDALTRELAGLTANNIPHQQQGTVIITPHLGTTPAAWDADTVTAVRHYQPATAPDDYPWDATAWVDSIHAKVHARAGGAPWAPRLAALLAPVDPASMDGPLLVHTDPHLGNWVRKEAAVALLDWEAGFRLSHAAWPGVRDYSLVLGGVPGVRLDGDAGYMAAVRTKAVTAASWAAWDAVRRGDADPVRAVMWRLGVAGVGW